MPARRRGAKGRDRLRRPRWGRVGLALAGLAALTAVPAWSAETVVRRVLTMGTWLELEVVAAGDGTAGKAAEAALSAVGRAEARLSTWREGSELATLNRQPAGEWVAVSPELSRDLGGALECARRTAGAFSPTVGALVAAWDLRGEGRVPTSAELEAAHAGAAADGLAVAAGAVRRAGDGVVVEEGGFGKGAALRDAAAAALAAGAHCVRLDFGGQLQVAGRCRSAEVGLASPYDRERVVAAVRLERGSMATSGPSERSVSVAGCPVNHLLDPRTGRPAPSWGSVTVLAADPLVADCLATGLYVAGPAEALAFAAREWDVEVIVALARPDGQVVLQATPGLRGRLTPSHGVELEWFEIDLATEPHDGHGRR